MNPDISPPPFFVTHTDRARAVELGKALAEKEEIAEAKALAREKLTAREEAKRAKEEAKRAADEAADEAINIVNAISRVNLEEMTLIDAMIKELNEVGDKHGYHLFLSGSNRPKTLKAFLLRCKKIPCRTDGLLTTGDLVNRWGLKANQHVLNFVRKGRLAAPRRRGLFV